MPELPEVETVVQYLHPHIAGKTVSKILHKNKYSKVFSIYSPEEMNYFVRDQRTLSVWRRGKYIVLALEGGYLYFHLRMTGHLLFKLGKKDFQRHITAELVFSDGTTLYFKDYRKFGRIGYCSNIDHINRMVGVEPLGSRFTKAFFQKETKKRKRQVKPFLLDQSIVAGLGNIYTDECLWRACINPEALSNEICEDKIIALHSSIVSILNKAIKLCGTTIINFSYGENSQGKFTSFLKVYGRAGLPCFRCNKKIKKIFVGQRGTYFCGNCQRK